ncbi:MAG: hypothetical protein K2X68_00270 [Novosphingobium sp.]|nr:hypothetical protein [Novosphingobium sp.]
MDSKSALLRAMTALGKKTVYKSPGHVPSFAASTFPANADLDCSGFVYWCIRFPSSPPESRIVNHPLYKKINGGWFETSAIHADGLAETGFFRKVEPVVGAFLVYPDYLGGDGKMHDGHIGMVTAIDPTQSGIARVTRIIHCSLGGWQKKGDAVQETAPGPWLAHAKSIAVWYDGFTDAPTLAAFSNTANLEAAHIDAGPASAGGPKEFATTPPNYRSLTANGWFSSNPYDLSVPRSIRTNNPGALNVTPWQRAFPGFVGETAPDHAKNVTSIYVTPENGIGAWHYLLTDRYKYGADGAFTLPQLAKRYAGVDDEKDKRVKSYVAGWTKWSPSLSATASLALGNDQDMLLLARGMFCHEAGRQSPISDEQIVTALALKRSGKLPKS